MPLMMLLEDEGMWTGAGDCTGRVLTTDGTVGAGVATVLLALRCWFREDRERL